jgi:hypothetical protein
LLPASELSPIAVANVAKQQAKSLIFLDGGGRSRDRTRLTIPNSQLTGKLTGNFAKFRPPLAVLAPSRSVNSMVSGQIPYATEQGILFIKQGKN